MLQYVLVFEREGLTLKAQAINLMENLMIKKNTNKYNYFKMKEIREIIDHIDNIKVVMLLTALLSIIVTVAFNLYLVAITLGAVVILAYFGLDLYQMIMDRKLIH